MNPPIIVVRYSISARPEAHSRFSLRRPGTDGPLREAVHARLRVLGHGVEQLARKLDRFHSRKLPHFALSMSPTGAWTWPGRRRASESSPLSLGDNRRQRWTCFCVLTGASRWGHLLQTADEAAPRNAAEKVQNTGMFTQTSQHPRLRSGPQVNRDVSGSVHATVSPIRSP